MLRLLHDWMRHLWRVFVRVWLVVLFPTLHLVPVSERKLQAAWMVWCQVLLNNLYGCCCFHGASIPIFLEKLSWNSAMMFFNQSNDCRITASVYNRASTSEHARDEGRSFCPKLTVTTATEGFCGEIFMAMGTDLLYHVIIYTHLCF